MVKNAKQMIYIEDEQEMIDLVGLILSRKGYVVTGAIGGRDGLDQSPALADAMAPLGGTHGRLPR